MRPEITLIKKLDADGAMSKRIFLDEHGMLRSDGSACRMANGLATRAEAETAAGLAHLIAECAPDQAIALGALKDELPNPVTITTKKSLPDHPGAISRTRRFIDYRDGEPAWALIDFDVKGMPKKVAAAIEARGGMWKALLTVAPGLRLATRVSRASTSAGLYRADTGERIAGSGGAHHYLMVKDGGDVERFLLDLHDHCWLHGLGWHQVGRAGQLLDRSLVDRMVAFGERLCFEGAPAVEPPLRQEAAERIPEAFEGEAIDTGLVVPKLTEYERHRVDEAKALSAAALSKTAAEVGAEHDRSFAEKVSAKTGMPLVSAQRLVAARHRGVLLPHFELDLDHLGLVPVADVLADPDRYVDETLADPLEGADYGRCKAKVMRTDDGGLMIHSFAHGRSIYLLRHDLRSAKAALARTAAGSEVDAALAIEAASEMEADELADFAAAVAKAANVGVRAVNAKIAKNRKEREQRTRRREMAAQADGRIIKPRPEPDGELTPVVTFLDQLLAKDTAVEPPMRDATGNLVEVRVREYRGHRARRILHGLGGRLHCFALGGSVVGAVRRKLAFTSQHVAKAMTIKYDLLSAPVSDAERARADAIRDALGELVGKRLDRPTAHSIGKLFQKRLVNRPARIGDEQAVATLRRHQGHAENTYRVEVKGSEAGNEETIFAGERRPKHSPLSPHSPTSPPATTGDPGNVGKDGNVSIAAGATGSISSLSPALPRARGSGNGGDVGKVPAADGSDGAISPDATEGKPAVGEGEPWQEDI
jgi:hypothetical protein